MITIRWILSATGSDVVLLAIAVAIAIAILFEVGLELAINSKRQALWSPQTLECEAIAD